MAVVKMKHYEAGRSQDERLKLVTRNFLAFLLNSQKD